MHFDKRSWIITPSGTAGVITRLGLPRRWCRTYRRRRGRRSPSGVRPMLRFLCSNCGTSLKASPENSGRSAHCPKCRSSLVVPAPIVRIWPPETQAPPVADNDFVDSRTIRIVLPVPSEELDRQDECEEEYRCWSCNMPELPRVRYDISFAGWVVFAMLISVCFPLCFLGLLFREPRWYCPVCGVAPGAIRIPIQTVPMLPARGWYKGPVHVRGHYRNGNWINGHWRKW